MGERNEQKREGEKYCALLAGYGWWREQAGPLLAPIVISACGSTMEKKIGGRRKEEKRCWVTVVVVVVRGAGLEEQKERLEERFVLMAN